MSEAFHGRHSQQGLTPKKVVLGNSKRNCQKRRRQYEGATACGEPNATIAYTDTNVNRDESTALDDEYLRTATVGELVPLTERILLVEYDSRWPDRFEGEAKRIRTVLGEHALRVEHVGSTSVPGLIAKPIIDIVLLVTDSRNELAYAPALETAGYQLRIREPEWNEHRMFKGAAGDVNLHVFSAGCPEVDRMVTFRDWLRANAGDRELYAQSKRVLAQTDWKYTQNYADAKTAVIQQILCKAQSAGH